MPVDPQSPSVDVTSEEISDGGETVVVNTLVLRDVSATGRSVTYTCKPEDDILNLDADEIELLVTTTRSKLELSTSGVGTKSTLRGRACEARPEGRSSKPEGLSRGGVLGEGAVSPLSTS